MSDLFADIVASAALIASSVIAIAAWRTSVKATAVAESSGAEERRRTAKAERRDFAGFVRKLFDERIEELRLGVDENKPLYSFVERGRARSLDSPGGEAIITWMDESFKELTKWPAGMFRGYFVLMLTEMFELRTADWIKDPTAFDARPLDIQAYLDEAALREEAQQGARLKRAEEASK